MVLLHGGLLTIELMFQAWLPALTAAGHRVIVIELQGHGRTADVVDRPLSIDQLAVLPDTVHMDFTRRPDQLLALVVPFLAR